MMIHHFDLREAVLHDGSITIRPARSEDESFLLQWFAREDVEGRCAVRVVDEFTIWPFIILQNGSAAGFAQVWRTTDGTGGLEFFVAPDYRRRHIATTASAMLAKYLREKLGWARITVEPHTDDAAAIACFSKAGFVDRGERRDDGDHAHMILEWP